MKFFLISDNTDTQMGFRLAGIDGMLAHSREEVLDGLRQAEEDADIGVVLLTASCIALAPQEVEGMRRRGLMQTVRRCADGSRPFLGICLGLQLLFAASEESPGAAGLNLLDGAVKKFPHDMNLKIPHIGWNSIQLTRHDGIFADIPDEAFVYFVHSYFVVATDPSCVAARTTYGLDFDAAVTRGLMTAAQFHPEKSGEAGLAMLRNFTRGL